MLAIFWHNTGKYDTHTDFTIIPVRLTVAIQRDDGGP